MLSRGRPKVRIAKAQFPTQVQVEDPHADCDKVTRTNPAPDLDGKSAALMDGP